MNERQGMTVLVHSELSSASHGAVSHSQGLCFSALFLTSLLDVLLVCDSLHTSHWYISRFFGFCFPHYF